MSVKVEGLDSLLSSVEKAYGERAMQEKKDRALRRMASILYQELEKELSVGSDTGATIDEINFTDPVNYMGERVVRFYWEGPRNRMTIVHMTEWGTVKNPSPKAKGAIARALRTTRGKLQSVLKEEMGR